MRDTWLSNPRAALQTLGSSVRRGLDGLRGSAQRTDAGIGDLPARLIQVYALIDQARIAAPQHPERAALLAVEAVRRSAGCPPAAQIAAEQVLRDTLAQLGGLPLPGSARGTSAIALSRDGRTLAAGGHDGAVRVWDLTAPDPRAACRALQGHAKKINALALSADGRTLVSGSDDWTMRVWDLAARDPSAEARVLLGHLDPVEKLCLSGKGLTLVSLGADASLYAWDLRTHSDVKPRPLCRMVRHCRHALVISDDGRTLVVVDTSKGELRVWSLAAAGPAAAPRVLPSDQHRITTVALSRDGRILFSGDSEGTICRWAGPLTGAEHPTHQWPAHLGEVRNLALSADGQTLVSTGEDGAVRLWNSTRPQPTLRKAFYGFSDSAYGLALSANGQVLITQGRGWDDSRNAALEYLTKVWDLHPSNEFPSGRALRGPRDGAFKMALSDDGGTLVGCDNGDIWIWRQPAIPVHPAARALVGHNAPPQTITLSRDGQTLLSVGRDGAVIVWDLTAPDPSASVQVLHQQSAQTRGLAFSADMRTLLTSDNGRTYRWDVFTPDGKPIVRRLEQVVGVATAVAQHRDGLLLVTSGGDRVMHGWRIDHEDRGELLWSLSPPAAQDDGSLGNRAFCCSRDLSDDGTWLVTGWSDGLVRIYDTGHPQPETTMRALTGHTGLVMALKFSSDGRTLISGSDDSTARVWDLDAPDPHATVRVLRRHRDVIRALALSADGHTLVTSGNDETIACVWDLTASDPNTTVRVLRGLEYSLNHVALSADGRTLITAGGTGAAQVWDLSAPDPHQTVKVLRAHPEGLSAVAISPDGRTAYTAGGQFGDGGDRAILVWPLDPEALLQAAHRTVSRNLSGFEWARVFPNEPYRRTCPDLPDGHSVQYVIVR